MGGYPTFVISILGIGVVTGVIGDVASHVGCTIGLKDAITAICIVALGTSVPGTVLILVLSVTQISEVPTFLFRWPIGNMLRMFLE